jgi:hypothetical protein
MKREVLLEHVNEIQFIVVTTFTNLWDGKNITSFPSGLVDSLIEKPYPQNATCLFLQIRSNNDPTILQSAIGRITWMDWVMENGEWRLYFGVADLQPYLHSTKSKKYKIGLHLNKQHKDVRQKLLPPFLDGILTTSSWKVFEQSCFHLLKSLGIHKIHAVPQEECKGEPDGYFLFNGLCVIYDATLRSEYRPHKEKQIPKYIERFSKGKLHIGGKDYSIKNHKKQIWIITRTEQVKTLSIDAPKGIVIKEIPCQKLIEIYHKHLDETIDEDTLSDLLKNLS